MKALIQRVSKASVTVEGTVQGAIDQGFVVLLGVREGDDEQAARYLADKTVNLRVFPDPQGRMNLSLKDNGGGILVISQFTLYADTRKGNRPSFIQAAKPELAQQLYSLYVDALTAELGKKRVACGIFGAHMLVELINDGPVTIELNTDRYAKEN